MNCTDNEIYELISKIATYNKENREKELSSGFKNKDVILGLICKDAALLVYSINGCSATIQRHNVEYWIRNKLINDPVFLAKTKTIENVIIEYVEAALRFARELPDETVER